MQIHLQTFSNSRQSCYPSNDELATFMTLHQSLHRVVLFSRPAASPRSIPRKYERAFTLVELLVVISIIAVLAAILLSVTQKSKETANAAKCLSKLRAIGTAIQLYKIDKMAYPQSGHSNGYQFTGGSWWFSDVMPYLGNQTYEEVNDQKDTPLRCPTVKNRTWPFIDYGINGYALPHGPSSIPVMKIERPSTTFLVADSDASSWSIAGWTGPTLKKEFRFRHGNAANVLMFDGHVEKVTQQQLADPKADRRMKGLPE